MISVRRATPARLELAAAVLRRLHLEIRYSGLTAEQIEEGHRSTFLPHLRHCAEIMALEADVEALVHREPGETWCEPQIVLRFPDEWTSPIPPHVDEEPPWAEGRRYRTIVGVALTPSRTVDGALVIWPSQEPVELDPGDVVILDPETPHASGRNLGPTIRAAIYFRLLGVDSAANAR